MTSQIKHWTQYEAHVVTYDVTKFANLFDILSPACKIKVLNNRVPET